MINTKQAQTLKSPLPIFILILSGGIFTALEPLLALFLANTYSNPLLLYNPLHIILYPLLFLCGLLIIISAFKVNVKNINRVKTWSILVLILTIIGILFSGGLNVIGFILSFSGSVLGIKYGD